MFKRLDVKNCAKGYTLVEIIVVMFILVLVSATSVTAFQSIKKKKTIQKTAEEARDIILEARSLALAPPDNLTDLKYMRIEIDKDNKELRLVPILTANHTKAPVKTKIKLDVGKISFINLEFAATPPTYRACADTDKICHFDFEVTDTNKIGQVKSGRSKFCLTNDVSGTNPVKKCITIYAFSGLAEISDN